MINAIFSLIIYTIVIYIMSITLGIIIGIKIKND